MILNTIIVLIAKNNNQRIKEGGSRAAKVPHVACIADRSVAVVLL